MKKMPVKTWSTPVVAEEKKLIPCKLCGGHSFKASLSCEGFSYVRCSACGLVQMNPQPQENEIMRRYGAALPNGSADKSIPIDKRPEGTYGAAPPNGGATKSIPIDKKSEEAYKTDYLSYELANEHVFLNLQLLALKDAGFDDLERELFSKNKNPRVLDLGCATGSLLCRLRERGWETTGVEISKAQAEYGRHIRNLDVRDLPLEENHFPSGYFDVVLASHLIEHVNDPGALVQEICRILPPDGRLYITTPNIAGFQARLFGSRWRSAIFDHLYLFSLGTLKRLLREKGFVIEKTATWGGLAAGLAPRPLKYIFDRAAKCFGFGDVMIIRARR